MENEHEELIENFFNAARSSNVDELGPLIDNLKNVGLSIDLRDKEDYPNYKRTALIHACKSEESNLDAIKLLIDHKANVNLKDQEDKSPLLSVCEDENPKTEILEYLIEKGASVNSKDENGRIILYSVCKNENANIGVINAIIDTSDNLTDGLRGACQSDNLNTEIINLLIEKGANPNKKDKSSYPCYNNTPFHNACENSNISLEIVELLFEKKANPNLKNEDGKSVLHVICENSNNNEDILRVFIERGTQINMQDNDGKTCLHYAFEKDASEDIIKFLMDSGAVPNICEKEGKTCIYYACKSSSPNMELIELLIEKGSSLSEALLGACSSDTLNEDLIKSLLEKGAETNKKDKPGYPSYGKAPLHYICSNSSPTLEIFDLIVEKSDLRLKSGEFKNALHFQCLNDSPNEEIIKALIEKGSDLNEKDNDYSPFYYACKNENMSFDLIEYMLEKGATYLDEALRGACMSRSPKAEVLRILLEKGANPNRPDRDGYPEYKRTALHHLCLNENFNLELVEIIAEKVTDFNVLDSEGNSALHCACKNENSNIDVVNLLIEKGANDWNGALRGACLADNINLELVELLFNKGATPNERDQDGNFAINLACDNRNATVELLDVLFKNGASPNSKGKNDKQPLHIVCNSYSASKEMIERLLTQGADINGRDEDERTPLLVLCDSYRFNSELAKLLIKKGAPLNVKNKSKQSPLFFLLKNSNKMSDMIDYFISKGANDFDGGLHGLCRSDKLNMEEFQLLLEKKANLNARDNDGKTPLHVLCENSSVNFESVEFLLKHKADLNLHDNENEVAFYYFSKNSNSNVEIANLFIKYGETQFESGMIGECENDGPNIEVMELIVKKANLKKTKEGREQGKNALLCLCENKASSVELVNFLIENGSPLNDVDKDGLSALHYACKNDIPKLEVVQCLVEKGIDVKIKDKEGKTGFNYLYKNSNESALEIAKYLINKGYGEWDESLRSACANDSFSLDSIKFLFEKKANPNTRSNYEYSNGGKTCLHFLCENKSCNPDVLEFILSQKADPNIKDSDGKIPLQLYFENDNTSFACVEILLTHKANPNLLERRDHSTLYFACKNKNISMNVIELLIKHGANNFSDGLCGNCDNENSDINVVKFLLEKKADPKTVNHADHRKNAFLYACGNRYQNPEIIKHLISVDKDVLNFSDMSRSTGLHMITNSSSINQEVLSHMSKLFQPSVVDDNEKTALHILADCYYTFPIKFFDYLFDLKYDPNALDDNDLSPFYYMCKNEYFSIDFPLLFMSKGANKLDQGLLGAVQTRINKFDLIKMLVDMGASVNSVTDENKTSLHLLSENSCNIQIANYLISKGVNVNAIDEDQLSALYYACKNDGSSLEYIHNLIEKGANNWNDGLAGAAHIGNHDLINFFIQKGANDFSRALYINSDNNFQYEIIKHMIEKGAKINTYFDPSGKTNVLQVMARGYKQNSELFEYILSKGGDHRVVTEKNENLLKLASDSDSLRICQILGDKGVSPNEKDKEGESSLYTACEENNIPLVNYLIKIGANDWNGGLTGAAYHSNFELMELMIQKGANDFSGALLNITRNGSIYLDTIKYLVSKGASPNYKDKDGYTSLYHAVAGENRDIINYLLEIGANDFDSGLAGACRIGNFEYLDLMISKGAKDFNKGLIASSQQGRLEMIEKMISLGANDFDGALHKLVSGYYHRQSKAIHLLLSKGANVNKKIKGKNSIHAACNMHCSLFKKLLEKAEINAVDDEEGNSYLHFACKNHNYLIVRDLLEHKIDVNIVNKNGKTAKQICEENGFILGAQMISQHK